MKNNKTLVIILIIVAALVTIKLVFLQSPVKSGGNNAPGKGPGPASVTAYIAQASTFDTKITASGTLLANEEVDLKAEASGKITRLLFKEGDKVSKGELLLKLNDADLSAQLKKLELQVKLAEDKEARQKKLLAIQGISQEEYDASLNQLNGLKADMEFTHAQVGKTEVRAPFNGTVGLKSVSEGSYVSPSVTIASIQQIDPVKIDFSVPEKYSGMVQKGMSIRFTVDGQGEEFSGQVYAIEPRIDLSTRTLQLRASCPNKEGKLLPGAFARIELVLRQKENTILIPTEALVPELKGQKVFVSRNGMAQPQKVETGARTDRSVEITKGLKAGDTVITTGIMQLKPNTPLKIISIQE